MNYVKVCSIAAFGLVALACRKQDERIPEPTRAAALPAPAIAAAPAPAPAEIEEVETEPRSLRAPDVVFVPTPEPVVEAMLRMAAVGPDDVVYDLGCGDGRIAIAAVRDFGARRSVCIDIDPKRIREARANVEAAALQDRVEVRQADLFETDLSEPTVVTLYLLDRLNLKLRPKLRAELPPGARVVSQTFSMGDWQPDKTQLVDDHRVYLWTIGPDSKKHARLPAPQ